MNFTGDEGYTGLFVCTPKTKWKMDISNMQITLLCGVSATNVWTFNIQDADAKCFIFIISFKNNSIFPESWNETPFYIMLI